MRTAFRLSITIGCGLCFLTIAYFALSAGHPSGDAYILFRYVENTADGHGIVYNVGGERAEGSTDFLWFLLLTIAVRFGADVAIAAGVLNALGAALAGWVLADLSWGETDRPAWVRAALASVALLVVFSGGALAAYYGFSSMLYSGLILLLFAHSVSARGSRLLVIPVLALTVALFRPDGVIIGAIFGLIGLKLAWSGRILGRYIWTSAACALGGLVYFAWRWSYFGLPLPLPLYVKQHSSSADASGWLAGLPGLPDHVQWLRDPQGPALLVLGTLALILYARAWRSSGVQRALVSLLPGAALLAALAFAAQSQNVEWRFQAPVQLLLAYALLYIGSKALALRTTPQRRFLVVLLMLAVMIPTSLAGMRSVYLHLGGRWNTYLETFAPSLGPILDEDSIVVLTEAGILPYWSRAHFVDVVGLNTVETALRPASMSYLKDLDPDMVFFHHAGLLDATVLTGSEARPTKIVRISPDTLWNAVPAAEQELVQRGVQTYAETGMRTTGYAALSLAQFLSESSEYEILTVDFNDNGAYSHIYGLKTEWPLRSKIMELLNSTARPERYRSYLSFRAEP